VGERSDCGASNEMYVFFLTQNFRLGFWLLGFGFRVSSFVPRAGSINGAAVLALACARRDGCSYRSAGVWILSIAGKHCLNRSTLHPGPD